MSKEKKLSNTHHITFDRHQGDWKVQRGGAERATSRHPTKREAENAGREVSRKQGTELVIHNKDGKIARKDSHGHDPHPPKG